jgi:glucosylceramidase
MGVNMSSQHSRRDFLKLSSIGAAALATTGPSSVMSQSRNSAPSVEGRNISAWVTDDERHVEKIAPIRWQPVAPQAAQNVITLNPEKRFQDILGFGAAFTDAACYTLNRLTPEARAELFHQLFHPSEIGLSVCRTCMGSSDYATKVYSYCDGEADPELKRFSIEHDRAYILPILLEARKVNPDLFLFSSPWSPPGWMKANGSMLGGSMRREYMPAYANYFVKFLQSYEAEGVPVQAITIQNEVDTDQDGRMPACIWPQEYEADFVRNQLGPLFRKNGVSTKIWLIDHNYNLWGRAIAELQTPGVRDYANAIAWHGYVGKPEWIDRVHTTYPEAEMYWTEGGPDYTDPNYARDAAQWGKTFADILRNCCRSITTWNLVLDEQGRPNIGPFNCGGLLTIHSQNNAISHSGQFWALAHYARFIRRRARRFDSQSAATDLYHAAFANPDGRQVLVLSNPGSARTCEVRTGELGARVALTENSVTTLEWTGA